MLCLRTQGVLGEVVHGRGQACSTGSEAFPEVQAKPLMKSTISGTLLQSLLKPCLPWGKSLAPQESSYGSAPAARETPSSSSVPPAPSTAEAEHCASWQKNSVFKSSSIITEQTKGRAGWELKGNKLKTGTIYKEESS